MQQVVGTPGVEPGPLAGQRPQRCAYANSATSPFNQCEVRGETFEVKTPIFERRTSNVELSCAFSPQRW